MFCHRTPGVYLSFFFSGGLKTLRISLRNSLPPLIMVTRAISTNSFFCAGAFCTHMPWPAVPFPLGSAAARFWHASQRNPSLRQFLQLGMVLLSRILVDNILQRFRDPVHGREHGLYHRCLLLKVIGCKADPGTATPGRPENKATASCRSVLCPRGSTFPGQAVELD